MHLILTVIHEGFNFLLNFQLKIHNSFFHQELQPLCWCAAATSKQRKCKLHPEIDMGYKNVCSKQLIPQKLTHRKM